MQVYYHLGAYDEALYYALGAATLLNINEPSEYVETVIGRYLIPLFSYLFCGPLLSFLSCSYLL